MAGAQSKPYDAIVLGGGAAGLFYASRAGARGRRVCVLERASEPGRKILISGGGRCNFTNAAAAPGDFICGNPHFHKSALARYTPEDFMALLRLRGIPYHEKKLGQMFCDRSARDIVRLLLDECRAARVEVVLNCSIAEVRRDTAFTVETSRGAFRAPALVVACGGLSIPKLGATSFGYDVARRFGLRIAPTRPALAPLTFDEAGRARWADLAGVSLDAVAACNGRAFYERILVTHRGLSGPAILQISSYWDGSQPIQLDLLPGDGLPGGDKSALLKRLPKRFAERWLSLYGGENLSAAALEAQLHAWQIHPAGTEGYAKAEVTAGGVDTAELSSKTMEARRVPGLFFIGEVVDVTGHLGGFNFQWAWASAAAAAGAGLG